MTDARLYRVSGVRLRSTMVLPELTRLAGQRADCRVDVSRAALQTRDVVWFHRWRSGSQGTWLRIGRGGDGYVLRFPDLADFDVSRSGRRVVAHPSPALPPGTLRHLLLDQVLPLALGRMGRMAIHASAVAVPGAGAIAFAGGPGSGKSTLAAALVRGGCALVSDDCLVVEVRKSRVWAIPSYASIRLWPDAAARLHYRGRPVAHYTDKVRVRGADLLARDRPVRLRALFLLSSPSARMRAVAVSPRDARDRFISLVRYTYLLDIEDRAALVRLFDQLGELSERVPIAGLRLPDDPGRLPEFAREVRRLASR